MRNDERDLGWLGLLLVLLSALAMASFMAFALWLLVRPLPVAGQEMYNVYLPAIHGAHETVHRLEGETQRWVYHAAVGDEVVVAAHMDGVHIECPVDDSGDAYFYLRNVGWWYFDADPTTNYLTWEHRVANFGDWYPQDLMGECIDGN